MAVTSEKGGLIKHLKITFCCCYAAEAVIGLRPVKMTVGGSTNRKALTTRPCAGGARVQSGMTPHWKCRDVMGGAVI